MPLSQRKLNRLSDYDYSENGAYYVTICTKNRRRCLSDIRICQADTELTLTAVGGIVEDYIRLIHSKYPPVTVDHYAIMPNHVHLLLTIQQGGGTGNPSPTERGERSAAPTLGNVIGWFKYQTTKAIHLAQKQAAGSFWQRSYYDHVVRDANDFSIRWNYIDGNPARWAEDEYYAVED